MALENASRSQLKEPGSLPRAPRERGRQSQQTPSSGPGRTEWRRGAVEDMVSLGLRRADGLHLARVAAVGSHSSATAILAACRSNRVQWYPPRYSVMVRCAYMPRCPRSSGKNRTEAAPAPTGDTVETGRGSDFGTQAAPTLEKWPTQEKGSQTNRPNAK